MSAAARRQSGRVAARLVVVDPTTVLSPGVVEWGADGLVRSLRRARRGERVDDVAVLPGLVNAHVHLQLPPLARRERRFLPWVRAVMAARADLSDRDHERVAVESLRALQEDGATAVGEIDSTGASPRALRRVPMAGRCYQELTGYHLRGRAAAAAARARHRAAPPPTRAGLSPHAPYSASADLVRAALRRSRHVAIHCAELPEEQEFLRTGRGPFRELLERLGRLPEGHRAPGCGAVRWLERLGALRPTTQLVHCQELERGDDRRIVAAGASVVVCPGTIDWFDRAPPPVARWLDLGIPVALGTDSRASNVALSMRGELARAAALWPELSPTQLLAMATVHGARSLGVAAGRLRRGGRADLLVVDARGAVEDTIEAFVRGEAPLRRVVAGGRLVRRTVER